MKRAIFVILLLAIAAIAVMPKARADFVCPVFNSDAVGMNNPNAVAIGGGDYTIIGPDVDVPDHATNMDGAGSPPGPHAGPGDEGYSPIWNS